MLTFNADEFRKAKKDCDDRARNLFNKTSRTLILSRQDDIPYNKRENYDFRSQERALREAKRRGF